MTRIRLLTIALLSSIASTAWADLRAFDVEPGYQQEVFAALRDILTPDPQRGLVMEAHGRVELLPSGQILVNAEPETLVQVEAVLNALRARPAGRAPRVELRYWAVLGTSRAAADLPPAAAPPRVLDGVLAELEKLHGDLTFSLLGTATAITESGQNGGVRGMTLSVEQMAHVQGDTLNAFISMKLMGTPPPAGQQQFVVTGPIEIGSLDLNTTLQRGEFLVLGESHYVSRGLAGPVFFIVHWAEQ